MTADVVGYSRLIGADEEGTIVALEALRADLNDPRLMEKGEPWLMKTLGKAVTAPPQPRS